MKFHVCEIKDRTRTSTKSSGKHTSVTAELDDAILPMELGLTAWCCVSGRVTGDLLSIPLARLKGAPRLIRGSLSCVLLLLLSQSPVLGFITPHRVSKQTQVGRSALRSKPWYGTPLNWCRFIILQHLQSYPPNPDLMRASCRTDEDGSIRG